jgi:hypothetical protein
MESHAPQKRIGRKNVIERGQPITAARLDKHGEVLGVPVGCAQQPLEYLEFHKAIAILQGFTGSHQERHYAQNPWATIGFILH